MPRKFVVVATAAAVVVVNCSAWKRMNEELAIHAPVKKRREATTRELVKEFNNKKENINETCYFDWFYNEQYELVFLCLNEIHHSHTCSTPFQFKSSTKDLTWPPLVIKFQQMYPFKKQRLNYMMLTCRLLLITKHWPRQNC